MGHAFEVRKEIEVEATPEDVWEAVATGPGMDAWFLGSRNEVEPRLGGTVRLDFGEGSEESTITAWEPPYRFAHQGEAAPDGSLHAFEYVIEGHAGGRTVVRLVHSGFLADDWESEYDALNEGDFMYLHLMAQYVERFRGRAATVVSLWRSDEPDRRRALAAFRQALGLPDEVREGQTVRADLDGIGRIDGVVDFVSPGIVGVRTDDALYRFMHAPQKVVFLGHHIYRAGLDGPATVQAWRTWFDRTFAATGA